MDTLMLSATYEPLQRIDWRRAMSLWIGGRVEVLEAYTDRMIRTTRQIFQMPAVVRYVRGLRHRSRHVRFSRQNVYGRDRGRCQYCLLPITIGEATFDHIVPRSRGGRTSWENVVIACRPCNQVKGDRAPEEAGMRLRSHPVKPKHLPETWGPPISWRDGLPKLWRPYLRALRE